MKFKDSVWRNTFLICRFYWICVRNNNTFYGKQEGRHLFTKCIFCQNQILMGQFHCFILTSLNILLLLVHLNIDDYVIISANVSCEKKSLGEWLVGGIFTDLPLSLCFIRNLVNVFQLSKTFWRTLAEPYKGLRLSVYYTKILDWELPLLHFPWKSH